MNDRKRISISSGSMRTKAAFNLISNIEQSQSVRAIVKAIVTRLALAFRPRVLDFQRIMSFKAPFTAEQQIKLLRDMPIRQSPKLMDSGSEKCNRSTRKLGGEITTNKLANKRIAMLSIIYLLLKIDFLKGGPSAKTIADQTY